MGRGGVARKDSVTAANLAALGAERLAALLLELGEGDSAVRKRLVLAVAERGGAAALIKAVDRRLTALADAYADIPWERQKAYAAEVDGLRGVITQSLAPVDAPAAAERLCQLIRLAPGVLQRVDDSNGRFDDIFRTAVTDLGAVCGFMEPRDTKAIAGDVLALIQSDPYGVCDGLVAEAAPALGPDGLLELAQGAQAALAQSDEAGQSQSPDGGRFRLLQALCDVADARGDPDGYIAVQISDRGVQIDVNGIASRLIDAGRATEALTWLDGSAPGAHPPGDRSPSLEWERDGLRIKALLQLGRKPEAQTTRWRLFEQTLSVDVLRAYLRALPDFEDDAALDRAFAIAAAHPAATAALSFLATWPNLRAAAKLALDRESELDGRDYHALNAAAEILADAHPLAATVVRRRMIDSVLERAASPSYAYAAKNLAACAQLAAGIDWTGSQWPSHADYVADLIARHGRKDGFWSKVKP